MHKTTTCLILKTDGNGRHSSQQMFGGKWTKPVVEFFLSKHTVELANFFIIDFIIVG